MKKEAAVTELPRVCGNCTRYYGGRNKYDFGVCIPGHFSPLGKPTILIQARTVRPPWCSSAKNRSALILNPVLEEG